MKPLRFLASLILAAAVPGLLTAQARELKDPHVARARATYVPGGGHIYTGEYVRGGLLIGAAFYAGLQVVKAATCGSDNPGDYTYSGDCPPGGARPWLGVIGLSWIYGIYDAEASAERVDSKIQKARNIPVSIGMGAEGGVRLSLRVSIR